MSCQIKVRSVINDLNKIKKILFPNERHTDDDQWSDKSWSWGTDSEEAQQDSAANDWLHNCKIAASPYSEILVVGTENRIAVLTSKWEKNEQGEKQNYYLTYHSSFLYNPGEIITSILCMPINSQQRSNHGIPDWICILVGFNTGFVRAYTTEGKLLMTQIFHQEPVQHLKLCAKTSNLLQELCILYQKVVVTVESLGLYNSLRACRNYLAKGQAFFSSNENDFQPPPLTYKKYSLQEQQRTNDCEILGTFSPNHFDHLVTASVAGGFHAKYNNSPPVSTSILNLGSQPYCAWHFALEGSATPFLTDLAYALASKVTSKLMSAAGGWFSWGGNRGDAATQKNKDIAPSEPGTPIYPKIGLSDTLREAYSVILSPNAKLAAVIDSLGRIALIDVYKGIAIRLWKGYRDAQCAWVESWENVEQRHEGEEIARTVMFLVFYISKRGIMEVWAAQQGTRVAAFNVSKGGKLLQTGTIDCDRDLSQCCLLYPDGTIIDVVIPFHCCLKGDSSLKARDLHLLQELHQSIKKDAKNPRLELLLEMRHAGTVSQGLDCVLENPYIDAELVLGTLNSIINQYNKAEALDAESRLLWARSRLLYKLLNFYTKIYSIQRLPPDYDTVTKIFSPSNIASLLKVSEEEVSRTAPKYFSTIQRSEIDDLNMHNFVRAFELSYCHSNEDCIRVKSSLNQQEKGSLSSWIFGTFFSRNINLLNEFEIVWKQSHIIPEDTAQLLLTYWLHQNPQDLSPMEHFYKLLFIICDSVAIDDITSIDHASLWWQKVQDLLCKSTNLEQACRAAMVCRSITLELEEKKVKQLAESKGNVKDETKMDESMGEWENLSVDMIQWNMMLKQSEDLLFLSRLIGYKPIKLREFHSDILAYHVDNNQDSLSFTLFSILQKGRGSVTELVARWLTQNLLKVDVLFVQKDITDSSENVSCGNVMEVAEEANKLSLECLEETAVVRELFENVSRRLPHSIERDVLLLNTALEYAAMWVKNPKFATLLHRSVETVLSIRSSLSRHGMCRMIWSMSLLPIFRDLATMMDKMGRIPRNFISRKINLPSPDLVVPFLEAVIKVLDTAIVSAMSSEMEPPPAIRYDDLWSTCEGATPILEVAIRQRLINIDLALLHLQLSQVLYLMAILELKGVHPFSFFDQGVGRLAFFQDLHTHPPLPSHYTDPTVISNRLHFLKLAISKAIDLMECNQSLALNYISQSMKLAYDWTLDVDELRIYYVYLLYCNGMDQLAQEVLPSIGSNTNLASTLLKVAGLRLNQLLETSHIASLSPITTSWLNQHKDLPVKTTSPKDTSKLLVEILSRIKPDSNEQFIASELHSAVITLLDSEN